MPEDAITSPEYQVWKLRDIGGDSLLPGFAAGREYQGINVLLLGLLQFASPWWMTYRQTLDCCGNVRRGEHGAIVMKFGSYAKADESKDGTEETKTTRRFLKSYHVFNASQIEGVEFPKLDNGPELDPSERIQRAEEIVAKMPQKPTISEGRLTKAAYRPRLDTIEMPPFGSFDSPEDYHLTLFHELIHSTGHESRLDRKGIAESDGFGGKTYSQEELVAEMGAAFLAMEAEIVRDQHEQSAAYLNGWLSSLREPDHRRWIVQAANQAGRAADFILGRSADESSSANPPEGTAEESLPAAA